MQYVVTYILRPCGMKLEVKTLKKIVEILYIFISMILNDESRQIIKLENTFF